MRPPASSSSSFSFSFTSDVYGLGGRGNLYKALEDKGIRTIIDDEELQKGEEITPALLKAIEESRIVIIVFSKDYASSRWCLDELISILERRKKGFQKHEKDLKQAAGVRGHDDYGSCSYIIYRLASSPHEETFTNSEKVQKWMGAGAYNNCRIVRGSGAVEEDGCRTMFNQTEPELSCVPGTSFIFSNMTAYVGGPLKLALCNAPSDQYLIATINLKPSMKTEICILDDEPGSEGNENWMQERDAKGPLLSGDRFVTVIGYWKIDGLSMGDPAWRLKKIAKYGKVHLQLSRVGIEIVQDLLLLCKYATLLEQVNLLEETKKKPGVPQLYKKEHSSTLNQRKRREEMARFSSSLVTLTFPLLLFSTVLMNPLKQTHGFKSILLALPAMFNFMAFASAVSVMITVGAQFTKIQMILLTISPVVTIVLRSSSCSRKFVTSLLGCPLL